MKKVISAIVAIALCLPLMAFLGKTNNVVRTTGPSDKFSDAEIKSAMNRVIDKFMLDYIGCELTDLWYDEERSNQEVNSYLEYGRGTINNVKAENVIVLYSNFNIGENGPEMGFDPNSTCSGWSWVLIRDDKYSEWRVDDWGY